MVPFALMEAYSTSGAGFEPATSGPFLCVLQIMSLVIRRSGAQTRLGYPGNWLDGPLEKEITLNAHKKFAEICTLALYKLGELREYAIHYLSLSFNFFDAVW